MINRMMRIDILTLFPEIFDRALSVSMLKQAIERQRVVINIHNIRDYTTDKHHTADDYPYGGGSGMVLKPEPIFRCMDAVLKNAEHAHTILLSPQNQPFTQQRAIELTNYSHLILICGHYKDIDHRVREAFVDEEISIGDYVLTGGELPALVVIDAVVRLLPGVLNTRDSAETDSYYNGILDTNYYTRPPELRGRYVPEVLLSGNHEKIRIWRRKQALKNTWQRRPELLEMIELTKEDYHLLNEIKEESY